MVANFTRPSAHHPSLLTHQEVGTLWLPVIWSAAKLSFRSKSEGLKQLLPGASCYWSCDTSSRVSFYSLTYAPVSSLWGSRHFWVQFALSIVAINTRTTPWTNVLGAFYFKFRQMRADLSEGNVCLFLVFDGLTKFWSILNIAQSG